MLIDRTKFVNAEHSFSVKLNLTSYGASPLSKHHLQDSFWNCVQATIEHKKINSCYEHLCLASHRFSRTTFNVPGFNSSAALFIAGDEPLHALHTFAHNHNHNRKRILAKSSQRDYVVLFSQCHKLLRHSRYHRHSQLFANPPLRPDLHPFRRLVHTKKCLHGHQLPNQSSWRGSRLLP